jgi:hypothetical protein
MSSSYGTTNIKGIVTPVERLERDVSDSRCLCPTLARWTSPLQLAGCPGSLLRLPGSLMADLDKVLT